MKTKWDGITHILGNAPEFVLRLWKKFFCKKGIHLFDEVLSAEDHSLYCDACGKTVGIAYIKTEEEILREMEE